MLSHFTIVIWCKNVLIASLVYAFYFIDIQCTALVPPTDDLEMLCDNGATFTTGEGYEGDTCFMSCTRGYELKGSDARTCQSDGTWTGNETTCSRGKLCIICQS